MPTEAQLAKKIAKLEKKRTDIQKIIAPLHDELMKNYDLLKKARDAMGVARNKRLEEEAVNFIPTHDKYFTDEELALILDHADSHGMTTYNFINKLVINRFGAGYVGLSREGYWPETMQSAFRIGLTRGDREKTTKVFHGLNYLVKHLKIHTKDGYDRPLDKHCYRFSIFENTLSANGSFHLEIYEDGTSKIHHRYRNDEIFTNLMDALIYIENHVYYDVKGGSDSSYYDYDERDED